MAYKTLFTFSHADWITYLGQWPFVPDDEPATQKQVDLMRKLYIPDWVIARLSKRAAIQVIRTRLDESAKWRAQQNKPKAPRATRKKKEKPHTPLIDWDMFSQRPPSEPQYDELDPDTPSKEDIALSQNIKTSLTPWLYRMVIPWSDDHIAVDWMCDEADPDFWIRYRQADIDPKVFENMLAEARQARLQMKDRWNDVI